MCSKLHVIQTALYVIEFLLSYTLMLCVMTFNAYLFIAATCGAVIGFQLCGYFTPSLPSKHENSRSRDTIPAMENRTDKSDTRDAKSSHAGYEQKQCLTSI